MEPLQRMSRTDRWCVDDLRCISGLRGYGGTSQGSLPTLPQYLRVVTICHTKFHRHEAKPSRKVTWTVIE